MQRQRHRRWHRRRHTESQQQCLVLSETGLHQDKNKGRMWQLLNRWEQIVNEKEEIWDGKALKEKEVKP